MKKLLFTILFISALTSLSAQLQDSFLLVGAAGTFSTVNDSTFRGNITFQTDQFGSGYLPTGIQVDYKLIDAKGDIFTVKVVNSSDFTTANLDVEEDDANRTAPSGIVMVFAVLPSGLYPLAPVNSTGISPIMEARLHMANVITRGVGLDVGTMTDSLNTIRDSIDAVELALEKTRTDSLDRIRDSINAVLAIPEKLPFQDITVSAPSYSLRYDTINQHVVITENSQAYRSASGNVVISAEAGKTDIVGNELEINTDNFVDFSPTSLNDDIAGVIVENDAGQIRRTGTLVPYVDSLNANSITSIDLQHRYKARYKINCTSDPTIITLDLINPISGGVYTFRFFNVVDSITVAFTHLEDNETSQSTFGVSGNESKSFVFDSDGNYFLVTNASSTTVSSGSGSSFSALDTVVTSAGWSPSVALLDDYDFISATIQIESGDGTNGTLGIPTPTAALSKLEFYIQAWDENTTFNPILSAPSGDLWYDSTAAATSITLLNGHTYRLHVDQTINDEWIWVMNNITAQSGGGGTESIFKIENSSTNATLGTTDNYHEGRLGIGDFSSSTIGAPIHTYASDARMRLSDSVATDAGVIAYLEYYRGHSAQRLGRVGYLDNTDANLTLENQVTNGSVIIETEGTNKFQILPTGQLQLPSYGDTTFEGTAVKYLAVTDDGTVIEADGGGGGGQWTTTGSDIYFNTGNVGIGTTSPGQLLELSTSSTEAIMKMGSTLNTSKTYLTTGNNGRFGLFNNQYSGSIDNNSVISQRMIINPGTEEWDFEIAPIGSTTYDEVMRIKERHIWMDTLTISPDDFTNGGSGMLNMMSTAGGVAYFKDTDLDYGISFVGDQFFNINANWLGGSAEDATSSSWQFRVDPVNDIIRFRRAAAGGSTLSEIVRITPDSLTVNGDVKTVNGSFIDDGTTVAAPDYVFESSYNLLPIADYVRTIQGQKHLIGARSAKELEKEVPLMEEMYANRENIEVQGLYIGQLLEKIEALEKRIKKLERKEKRRK